MNDRERTTVIELLAAAIGRVAADDEPGARELLRAVSAALRGNQAALPGIPAPSGLDPRKEVIARLFAYWRERCAHPAAKLTSDRVAAIGARLREGYKEEEIRKAIDGAAAHAFVGENGTRHDDLVLICRSGSKLEDFVARGVKATGEIAVATSAPVEEQIAGLRREMSELKRAGRSTEYDAAAQRLAELMRSRT